MSKAQAPPPPRISWRNTAARFPVIFLPLFAASLLIVGAVYWNQSQTDQTILDINQRDQVKLQGEIIAADFRSVTADLMLLAGGQTLRQLLSEDRPESRGRLAEEFRSFLGHKRVYDQIRLIGDTGVEVVRVNSLHGKPSVVPDDQLQVKKDRYYFAESLRLPRGEVFVSPFDLNMEEGQVERPLKPTIRFATPVFDGTGRNCGILVLNYLGARLIDKLRLHSQNDVGEPWLLNAEGYWLAGPDAEVEWGFMFTDRRHATLASQAPNAWRRIASRETGQFRDVSGMYTYRTVYPVPTHDDAGKSTYHWKLVSHVSPETLSALSQRFSRVLWGACGGLALMLAAVSWFIAKLTIQNRAARERLLQRERLAAVGEAMTALAHECRNALQRSKAGLEMLAKRVGNDEETGELLRETQEAQTYLTELYEEVRGYAAPVNLRRDAADLRQLLEQTWSQAVERGTGPLRPTLQVESESEAVCQVDARAMGQVFRNVLENAVAADNAVQVRVRITEAQLAGQSAWRMAIRDNGPGIAAEERKRMFEPFFTTKTHGAGLGLAISRRIVEAHGGTIEAGVTDGPGTEIIITLPRIAP